jgi:hypothetical protein
VVGVFIMEQWLFYYCAWLFWILVYFFDSNRKRSNIIAVYILLSIIATNWYVTFHGISIFLPLILNLFTGFVLYSVEKKKYKHIWLSISLSFLYGGLKLWEHLNPLWLFAPTCLYWTAFGCLFMYFSSMNHQMKWSIWLTSSSVGQMMYGLIRLAYQLQETIGDFSYLLDILLLFLIYEVIDNVQKLGKKMEYFLHHVITNKR